MSADRTIRVLLAEDDYLVREGALAVLAEVGDIEVLGAASHPGELTALLERHQPDVVMLDIRMPPSFTTEGIDLALAIRAERPEIGVVMLSQYAEPEYVLELLGDGSAAVAYLLKERLGDARELAHAIRQVAAGGSVLDPKIVDALLEVRTRRADSGLTGLTAREMDVLAKMAGGRSNAAIASALGIAERSVETHTGAIFGKLGLADTADVNRRVAAVVFYLQRSC